MTRTTSEIPFTSKSKKKGEKKGDQKRENCNDYANDKGNAPLKLGNKENKPKNKDRNSKGCSTCGGSHQAKSCPNKERVKALLAGKLNQDEEGEEVMAAMTNPLGFVTSRATPGTWTWDLGPQVIPS